MSAALAGGGIHGGIVVGASDARAENPKERLVEPAELVATLYALLGINPRLEFHNEVNRPIALTPTSSLIRELL
jgi:hypothetical protein